MMVSATLVSAPAAPFVLRTHASRSLQTNVWRASASAGADAATDAFASRRRQVLSLGAATLALSLSSK